MAEKLPLIVGIDPGTTTGIALLDLDGGFVAMWSDKNISRSDLAGFISEFGTPVVVCGDTNPVPRAVEKIASLFSSKVMCPDMTLSRREKYNITKNYSIEIDGLGKKWTNRHERDALASALHAWGSIRNLMDRVGKKVKPYMDQELEWHVKSKVILEGCNTRKCIQDFIQNPAKDPGKGN